MLVTTISSKKGRLFEASSMLYLITDYFLIKLFTISSSFVLTLTR